MTLLFAKENLNPEKPCIITCALSGVVANRNQCPAIPYTPEEYAREAKSAYDAGAAAVHIHARDPDEREFASGAAVVLDTTREILEVLP